MKYDGNTSMKKVSYLFMTLLFVSGWILSGCGGKRTATEDINEIAREVDSAFK
jgi:hypothetical protein